jgi:hypothetical protein
METPDLARVHETAKSALAAAHNALQKSEEAKRTADDAKTAISETLAEVRSLKSSISTLADHLMKNKQTVMNGAPDMYAIGLTMGIALAVSLGVSAVVVAAFVLVWFHGGGK